VTTVADSIPKDNLVDAFRNLCQWNGKTYGVGHSPASSVFVYRKDLLAQKGLKVPPHVGRAVQVPGAEGGQGRPGRALGAQRDGAAALINIAVGEL